MVSVGIFCVYENWKKVNCVLMLNKEKRTLIIVPSKNQYFWKYVDLQDIDICETYRKEFKIKWFTNFKRKYKKCLCMKFGILSIQFFLLYRYHTIIFMDSAYTRQVNPLLALYKGEIIFFFWNKMPLEYELAERLKSEIYKRAKIFSYSRYDCERHHIKYNSTMYCTNPMMNSISKNECIYDVLYVGYVTGNRTKQLDQTLKQIDEQGISYYVHACDTRKKSDQDVEARYFELKNKAITYDEYLKILSKSKAILDICKCEGVGCTLRAMEAIFYQKKYITNDVNIVKENFYDKRNVFVLGVDNIDDLKEFIESPYAELPQEIVDYYRIENWIKRFQEEQNEQ